VKPRYRIRPEDIIESQGITQLDTEELSKDLHHFDSHKGRNEGF
jgi:hypothetical protein